MKATELRIGNWVSAYGKHTQVAFMDFECMVIDVGADEYTPIPLTEEWLLMFGFEIDWIIWHGKAYFNMLQNGDSYYYSADQHHHTSEAIKYVHQLQNLFFALTGEELTIKDA